MLSMHSIKFYETTISIWLPKLKLKGLISLKLFKELQNELEPFESMSQLVSKL
jgi:hypothetical protein